MEIDEAIKFINHPLLDKASKTYWADLGSGTGLFTHALARTLAPGSTVYAIDKDLSGFKSKQDNSKVTIEKREIDFTSEAMAISNLDGILMANSLHFISDKASFINKSSAFFKQQSCFLIVEYDTDISNPWVPYPISFHSLVRLFVNLGYEFIHKIHEAPSRFNQGNLYSVLVNR
jgi:ubiquinone/menaquinone biosynthesis C-methylase UbiE